MASRPSLWIDRSAIALSGLCLLHCLGGALILVFASTLGGFFSHEVHAVGFVLAAPLAAYGLVRGVRAHGHAWLLAPGGLGLALMIGALFVGHGTAFETIATIAGVSLLAAAHLANIGYCRRSVAP